jgi:hypothetical protein
MAFNFSDIPTEGSTQEPKKESKGFNFSDVPKDEVKESTPEQKEDVSRFTAGSNSIMRLLLDAGEFLLPEKSPISGRNTGFANVTPEQKEQVFPVGKPNESLGDWIQYGMGAGMTVGGLINPMLRSGAIASAPNLGSAAFQTGKAMLAGGASGAASAIPAEIGGELVVNATGNEENRIWGQLGFGLASAPVMAAGEKALASKVGVPLEKMAQEYATKMSSIDNRFRQFTAAEGSGRKFSDVLTSTVNDLNRLSPELRASTAMFLDNPSFRTEIEALVDKNPQLLGQLTRELAELHKNALIATNKEMGVADVEKVYAKFHQYVKQLGTEEGIAYRVAQDPTTVKVTTNLNKLAEREAAIVDKMADVNSSDVAGKALIDQYESVTTAKTANINAGYAPLLKVADELVDVPPSVAERIFKVAADTDDVSVIARFKTLFSDTAKLLTPDIKRTPTLVRDEIGNPEISETVVKTFKSLKPSELHDIKREAGRVARTATDDANRIMAIKLEEAVNREIDSLASLSDEGKMFVDEYRNLSKRFFEDVIVDIRSRAATGAMDTNVWHNKMLGLLKNPQFVKDFVTHTPEAEIGKNMDVLKDAFRTAAYNYAKTPDGGVDVKKLNTFLKNHSESLNAPSMKPIKTELEGYARSLGNIKKDINQMEVRGAQVRETVANDFISQAYKTTGGVNVVVDRMINTPAVFDNVIDTLSRQVSKNNDSAIAASNVIKARLVQKALESGDADAFIRNAPASEQYKAFLGSDGVDYLKHAEGLIKRMEDSLGRLNNMKPNSSTTSAGMFQRATGMTFASFVSVLRDRFSSAVYKAMNITGRMATAKSKEALDKEAMDIYKDINKMIAIQKNADLTPLTAEMQKVAVEIGKKYFDNHYADWLAASGLRAVVPVAGVAGSAVGGQNAYGMTREEARQQYLKRREAELATQTGGMR